MEPGEDDAGWRSCTACSAHHGPEKTPTAGSAPTEALALTRLNALDASVKGALEHGVP